MAEAREYHRVRLEDLPAWEAEGWEPAVTRFGAVGADPFNAGLGAEVLVVRPLRDDAPAGEE